MKTRPRAFVEPLETQDIYSGKGSVRCLTCRGRKRLCGKDQCPVLLRYFSSQKIVQSLDSPFLEGSSPPSVFVGRYGYPHVHIGPLLPPQKGDTSVMDTPEKWFGKTIDEIVDFRSHLIRAKYQMDVRSPNTGGIVEATREIALAKNSVDMEAEFLKKPRGGITLYDEVQPHGPSGVLKNFKIDNPKFDTAIEKSFYDTDLRAKDAVMELYQKGVYVSRVQKAFSVGAFGIKKERKFVPTRWSITAVDSSIGEELKKKVLHNPRINEYRVYTTTSLDNRWVIIMFPSAWQYELIEAWFPSTTWNPSKKKIIIFGDHEFYHGRTTYATIGGCYYAARLAIAESLLKEKRQAGCVVLREAHPGYIMPVGVWNVRENVRYALRQTPEKFSTFPEALCSVSMTMAIPLKRWIETSIILQDRKYQKRLEDF